MPDLLQSRFEVLRQEMVEQVTLHADHVGEQTGRRRLDDRVLRVMASVPRHEYVPLELRAFAYFDTPLPIGFDKTISQPFIVALMIDLLSVQSQDRVLEIGTGLGYQAAILASLATEVYTVEIIDELAVAAGRRLRAQGFDNIDLKIGDGSEGWYEYAPFDKIVVGAAPELIPVSLLTQLKRGGRMVIPAGIDNAQQLILVEKDSDGHLETHNLLPVRFSALATAN